MFTLMFMSWTVKERDVVGILQCSVYRVLRGWIRMPGWSWVSWEGSGRADWRVMWSMKQAARRQKPCLKSDEEALHSITTAQVAFRNHSELGTRRHSMEIESESTALLIFKVWWSRRLFMDRNGNEPELNYIHSVPGWVDSLIMDSSVLWSTYFLPISNTFCISHVCHNHIFSLPSDISVG